MDKRNTFLYLKSNSGVFDTESRFYRFDLVNPIVARPDELIQVQATEIEVPISYYNIGTFNNYFRIDFDLDGGGIGLFEHTVPVGNYTAAELVTELNTISSIVVNSDDVGNVTFSLTTSFNTKTSKFSFVIAKTAGSAVDIDDVQYFNNTSYTNYISQVVGIPSQSINVSSATSTKVADNVCDLNRTNNIYLETDMSLESRNTIGEKSGILSKIQMSGDLFTIVHWQNNSGENITLDKKDNYLDHVNLRLVTENKEQNIDFNGAEFTITLLFSFIKKEPMLLGDDIQNEVVNLPITSTIYNSGDESDCWTDEEN